MKLSIHLVAWNGAKYISHLFKSLRNQTYQDWFLYVLDNHSADFTLLLIKKELNTFSVQHELIESAENLGFAGGHNLLYQKTPADYFLLLNQDIYLEPDCLEKTVKFLEEHPKAAAVSPRLMRWDFPTPQGEHVDSLGLQVFRNRRVVERGSGKHVILSEAQRSEESNAISREVFGVSGALTLFRKSAIDAVALGAGEMFDASYHSYKEDVDLAFRLRSAGWKSFILLNAVAYHDRAGAGPREFSDRAAVANKRQQSSWVKYHSYKNHLMTLYKNEYWQNLLLDCPWIVWYEVKKLAYFLLFDRAVLKGLWEIWRMRKGLRTKRLAVQKLRKIDWKEMRAWW